MQAILFSIIIGLMSPVYGVFAATPVFHFRAPETLTTGTPARITLELDTQGNSINAISGLIDVVGPVSIRRTSTSSSIISLWVSSPVNSSTSVAYEGIIPGGFDGVYSVSDQALKPGTLFSFDVIAHGVEPITITSSGTVYQNDGEGTGVAIPPYTIFIKNSDAVEAAAGVMGSWILNSIFACGIILVLWFLRNFFKKRHL